MQTRHIVAIPMLVLASVILLPLAGCSGQQAPETEAKSLSEPAEPSLPTQDWGKLRCDIMAGMLYQVAPRLNAAVEPLFKDGDCNGACKASEGARVDRVLDLFERLGQEADVLVSVQPDVEPEYCFRGPDNALLVVAHNTLISHLIDKVECEPPPKDTPWGRRIAGLESLEDQRSAKLFLGGIWEMDTLKMRLAGKRLDCEQSRSDSPPELR